MTQLDKNYAVALFYIIIRWNWEYKLSRYRSRGMKREYDDKTSVSWDIGIRRQLIQFPDIKKWTSNATISAHRWLIIIIPFHAPRSICWEFIFWVSSKKDKKHRNAHTFCEMYSVFLVKNCCCISAAWQIYFLPFALCARTAVNLWGDGNQVVWYLCC